FNAEHSTSRLSIFKVKTFPRRARSTFSCLHGDPSTLDPRPSAPCNDVTAQQCNDPPPPPDPTIHQSTNPTIHPEPPPLHHSTSPSLQLEAADPDQQAFERLAQLSTTD